MKHHDCTQCQEWELCPFHGDDAPPSTERAVEAISTPDVSPTCPVCMGVAPIARGKCSACDRAAPTGWADIAVNIDGSGRVTIDGCVALVEHPRVDPSWRWLGQDDPEVGSYDIYLDPATGGVWAVPR